MITKLIEAFKRHTLLSVYTLVLLLILFGMTAKSGTTHLGKIISYMIPLYIAYFVFYYSPFRSRFEGWVTGKTIQISEKRKNQFSIILLGLSLIMIFAHFIYLGGIPSIQALKLDSAIEIAQFRESITSNAPKLLKYINSFNLRGFIPFLILYFYIREKKVLYWITLIVGSFYAFSLMQKSPIFCIIIPVMFYALFTKKFLDFFIHLSIVVITIFCLASIANPPEPIVNQNPPETGTTTTIDDSIKKSKTTEIHDSSTNANIAKGLIRRVFYVPGETVARWFDVVPEKKPFLNGDGYRIVAKLKGTKYHDYSSELYSVMYPKFAKKGLKGTVNTASFVNDYANFGITGLIISGILLSILLILIESLFLDDFTTKFSLNIYSILIIGSTAVTTTLFSGGWGFILIMYGIFLRTKDAKKK